MEIFRPIKVFKLFLFYYFSSKKLGLMLCLKNEIFCFFDESVFNYQFISVLSVRDHEQLLIISNFISF